MRGSSRSLFLIGLLCIGVLAACGGDDGGEGSGATTAEQGGSPTTVTIGFLAPLSGPTAPAMTPLQQGAEAAIEYLNSGGAKADNVTYELESRDSGGDPNRDVVLIRELIDAGMPVVLGDMGSSAGYIAEQGAINQTGIVAFSSSPSDAIWDNAGLDKDYPWAFGVGGDDVAYVTPEVELAQQRTQNDKVAQIFLEAGSVPAWPPIFEDQLADAGIDVATASFAPTVTDVKSQLRDLQGSDADTLMIWAFGASLQSVLSGLDQIGWYPNIVALPDAGRPSLQEAIPAEIKENMVAAPIPTTFISADGGPATGVTAAFLEAWGQVAGVQPGNYDQTAVTAAYSFDAILAVDWAIADSDSASADDIRAALDRGEEIEGAMGIHSWTAEERSGFGDADWGGFDPSEPCGQGTCVAPRER